MDADIEHVLALSPAEAVAMSGRYTPRGWSVSRGEGVEATDADSERAALRAMMATYHEAGHAGFNASTAWGSIMLTMAALSTLNGDEHVAGMLAPLVGRCRRTHELFATHSSVLGVGVPGGLTPEELLGPYPEYREYLRDAESLGPDPASRLHWGMLAVNGALSACMQSPALQRMAEIGPRRFWPAARVLTDADSPNVRLNVLRRSAPAMWAELSAMLGEAMGTTWDLLASIRLDDPDAVAAVDQEIWTQIHRFTYDIAAATLTDHGHPCLTLKAGTELTRQVVDELAVEFPQIRGMISTDSSDPLAAALLMFGAENLVLHAPVPAHVSRLADVADVADLVSGAPGRRHVYVAARPAARWQQQFTLEPRAIDGEDPQRPVVAVQVPHVRDEQVVGVELRLVDEPDQLRALARADTDLGLLSSISLACTKDVAWRERWLPALAAAGRSTLLLDQGVVPALRAVLVSGEPVQYTLIAVGDDPDLLRRPVVLAVRLANDPLLLTPCSLSAGQAVATWLHLASGRRLAADLATTNRDHDILPSIVHHLTHDESVVGFW